MFIARVYLNRYSLKLVGASRMRKIIFYYYLFIQSTQQFERNSKSLVFFEESSTE